MLYNYVQLADLTNTQGAFVHGMMHKIHILYSMQVRYKPPMQDMLSYADASLYPSALYLIDSKAVGHPRMTFTVQAPSVHVTSQMTLYKAEPISRLHSSANRHQFVFDGFSKGRLPNGSKRYEVPTLSRLGSQTSLALGVAVAYSRMGFYVPMSLRLPAQQTPFDSIQSGPPLFFLALNPKEACVKRREADRRSRPTHILEKEYGRHCTVQYIQDG